MAGFDVEVADGVPVAFGFVTGDVDVHAVVQETEGFYEARQDVPDLGFWDTGGLVEVLGHVACYRAFAVIAVLEDQAAGWRGSVPEGLY